MARRLGYEDGTDDALSGRLPRSQGKDYRRGYFRAVLRLRNILRTCPGCWLFDPAMPETGCSYQMGVGEAVAPGCASRRPFARRSADSA